MRRPQSPRWVLVACMLCAAAAAASAEDSAPRGGAVDEGAAAAAAPAAADAAARPAEPPAAPAADGAAADGAAADGAADGAAAGGAAADSAANRAAAGGAAADGAADGAAAGGAAADVAAPAGDAARARRGENWVPLGHFLGGIPMRLGGGGLPIRRRVADGEGALPPSLEDFLSSLESGLGGARQHVMHLPSVFNEVLDEVMSDGLAGVLGSKNVEFSFRENRKTLVVKLNMPAAHGSRGGADPAETSRRMIHMSVIGGGARLRVKVETLSAGAEMIFEHTIQLPVLVTQEGIETVANPDGSATALLKVVGELPDDGINGESRMSVPGSPRSLHDLLFGAAGGAAAAVDAMGVGDENATDVIQALPSAADVDACRRKYAGPELRLHSRHCVCRTSPTSDGRAVCFAGVLSSAINIARRIGKGDKASEYKHAAIECAGHAAGQAPCLERLSKALLDTIYGDVENGEAKELPDRIRTAIESEDEGGSDERRSPLVSIAVLLLGFCLIPCLALTMLFAMWRRFAGTVAVESQASGSRNGLSSVLSQRPATTAKRRVSSGKIA